MRDTSILSQDALARAEALTREQVGFR